MNHKKDPLNQWLFAQSESSMNRGMCSACSVVDVKTHPYSKDNTVFEWDNIQVERLYI